jgi:sarcosine oxidase
MSGRDADVAVIGCGIAGLCLADSLARRGASVLCFERATPGQAQSGGVTRIFRHSHADPRLVRLAVEGRDAWRALEQRSGELLVGPEGVVMLGASGAEANLLSSLGAPVAMLSAQELRAKLPLHDGAEQEVSAAYDRGGGAIRVRQAVASLYESVRENVKREQVYGLARREGNVEVYSSRGVSTVREVFVTAGAETAALARADRVEIPEQRACHLRVTFAVSRPDALPCLLDRTGIFGETVYGSPTPDGDGYAIGISGDDGSVAADQLVAADAGQLTAIARRTEQYAKRAFPGALGAAIETRLCLATPLASGDDDFRAWRRDGVTYLAGHNLFKFAPIIGELLAGSADRAPLPEIFVPE